MAGIVAEEEKHVAGGGQCHDRDETVTASHTLVREMDRTFHTNAARRDKAGLHRAVMEAAFIR